MKALVRAAVLVNDRARVHQRQEARDGDAVCGGHADLDVVAETGHEIAEPFDGLRRYVFPAARLQQQPVELLQDHVGSPFFVRQLHSLRASDLLLTAGLGKAVEQLTQRWAKIDLVKIKDLVRPESCSPGSKWTDRAHLYVSPAAALAFVVQRPQKTTEIFGFIDQWFTVVRERQRHDSIARERAPNPAEHEAIRQIGVRRRRRVHDGFISVRPAERIQPARRMEDRGPRVPPHEPRPAGIADRVNLMHDHGRVAPLATTRTGRTRLTWPAPASRNRPGCALPDPGEWRRRPSSVAGRFSARSPRRVRRTEA